MKKTNIPWAPYIPDYWAIERGKRVLELRKRAVRENDEVVTCFRDGEVILRTLRRTEGFTISDKEIGYQGINEGDIVIHGMDGFAGAMGISKSTGKGSPVLVVCTPKNSNNSKFLIYYLRALAYNNVFLALSTGIRERSCDLKWNKISVLDFLLPPIEEQKEIAEIIDRKCGEVDAMVSLQEQVIEELKAYKQSVITEAVTKGLNPNAPKKPSHIDWVGEIPEHWETVKLSLLTSKIGSGKTPTGGATIYTESGIMFLRSQNIYNEGLKLDDVAFIPPSIDDTMINTRVKDGDVLLNITGGSIGRCYCINDKNIRANVNQHVCIIRPIIEELFGKYLQYVINSNVIQTQIRLCQTGSNREELNFEQIADFRIPFVPVSEQREIADFLDCKCAEIDALISLKQQKIEELREYKKSLIYEYVTGKKQVFPS